MRELSGDIMDRDIALTGGGALLKNLDEQRSDLQYVGSALSRAMPLS